MLQIQQTRPDQWKTSLVVCDGKLPLRVFVSIQIKQRTDLFVGTVLGHKFRP